MMEYWKVAFTHFFHSSIIPLFHSTPPFRLALKGVTIEGRETKYSPRRLLNHLQ